MIDRDRLIKQLGLEHEPYSNREAVEWLIAAGDQYFSSFGIIAEKWNWESAQVRGIVSIFEEAGVLTAETSWSNDSVLISLDVQNITTGNILRVFTRSNDAEEIHDIKYNPFNEKMNRPEKRKLKTTDEVHVHDITVGWLRKNIPSDIKIDLLHELEKFKEYWSISPWKKPISGVMGFRRWLRRVGKLRQRKQGGNDAN